MGTMTMFFMTGCPSGKPAARGSLEISSSRNSSPSFSTMPSKPRPEGLRVISPWVYGVRPSCTKWLRSPRLSKAASAAKRAPTSFRALATRVCRTASGDRRGLRHRPHEERVHGAKEWNQWMAWLKLFDREWRVKADFGNQPKAHIRRLLDEEGSPLRAQSLPKPTEQHGGGFIDRPQRSDGRGQSLKKAPVLSTATSEPTNHESLASHHRCAGYEEPGL